MNLETKLKEIGDQIALLQKGIDEATIKVKLLTKSFKAYEKLIEKAKQLEK